MKNKIYAVALLALGVISMAVSKDATGLVFLSIIAVPLFVSRKNWIY